MAAVLFSGNAAEAKTLEAVLTGLGAEAETIVVVDAGTASEGPLRLRRSSVGADPDSRSVIQTHRLLGTCRA